MLSFETRESIRQDCESDIYIEYCPMCDKAMREVDGLADKNYWCDFCDEGHSWDK